MHRQVPYPTVTEYSKTRPPPPKPLDEFRLSLCGPSYVQPGRHEPAKNLSFPNVLERCPSFNRLRWLVSLLPGSLGVPVRNPPGNVDGLTPRQRTYDAFRHGTIDPVLLGLGLKGLD